MNYTFMGEPTKREELNAEFITRRPGERQAIVTDDLAFDPDLVARFEASRVPMCPDPEPPETRDT